MLEDVRKKIDVVDQRLVALLEERLTYVDEVIALKQATKKEILDKNREQDILEKIAILVQKKEYEEIIVKTFQEVMHLSRNYQRNKME